MSDGSVNQTHRVWCRTIIADASTLDTAAGAAYITRARFNPTSAFAGATYGDWGTTLIYRPSSLTTYDSAVHAELVGAGVLMYRCVAMGVRVRNQTTNQDVGGDVFLTQQRMSTVDNGLGTAGVGTMTAWEMLDVEPGYLGAGNKPGVIAQAFWRPPNNTDYRAITDAGVLASDEPLYFQSIASTPQTFTYELMQLFECVGFGSQTTGTDTFIGSPTVFAESLGNTLIQQPQFCLERNMISDDILDYGAKRIVNKIPFLGDAVAAADDIFDVDIVDGATNWAREKLKGTGRSFAETAGNWISGLFGATGLDADTLRVCGAIVSLGDRRAKILQTLAADHADPGALYTWANGQLTLQGARMTGGLITTTAPSTCHEEEEFKDDSASQCSAGYVSLASLRRKP